MSTDHAQEFAAAALQAFDDRGLTTDEKVRLGGGPSNTTMTALRKVARGEAAMKQPRSDTMERIERAAGWGAGDGLRLWRHGDYPAPRDGVSGDVQTADYVAAPGEPAEETYTLADVMREIKGMRERLDRIEKERGS